MIPAESAEGQSLWILVSAIFTDELKEFLQKVVTDAGANGPQDMGKVMGMVTKKLAGQADGKTISTIVKAKLMS